MIVCHFSLYCEFPALSINISIGKDSVTVFDRQPIALGRLSSSREG
jgi:hypothetical protein